MGCDYDDVEKEEEDVQHLDIMLAASACSVHSATSPPSTFAFAALRLLTFCKEIKIKIFCGA